MFRVEKIVLNPHKQKNGMFWGEGGEKETWGWEEKKRNLPLQVTI
jgi:hypothetical protein